MADVSLHPDTLSALFQGALLVRWVPGVLYAGALLVAARRCHHYLTMPALLVAATGLFYLGLWLAGTSIVQARAQGLLLGPFPSSGLWPPLRLADLAQVNWTVLAGQSAPLLALVLVSTVSLLLNAAGVELATSRDMDVDRELLATGVANSVAGLGGGLPGYISLGKSMISHKIGADNRLVGLSSALMCGGALFFGASVLSYLPRPIMGGLLLYTGLDMLIEWVVCARRKLPAVDYVLVLLILGVIATIGFLQGVGAGDRSPPGYRGHCQANGVFRTTLQAGRRSVGLPGGPLRRISIHRDIPGHVELTGTAPEGAPLRQEATLGVEIAGEPRSSSRLPARRQVRS